MQSESSIQSPCLQSPYGTGVGDPDYLALVFWIRTGTCASQKFADFCEQKNDLNINPYGLPNSQTRSKWGYRV